MKYCPSVHQLVVASLVLAPATAGKESSKANKMMPVNELAKSLSLHYGSKTAKTGLYDMTTSQGKSSKLLNSSDTVDITGKSSKLEEMISLSMDSKSAKSLPHHADASSITGKASKIEDGISLSMDSKSVKSVAHTASPVTTGKSSKVEDISQSTDGKSAKTTAHTATLGTADKGAKSEKGVALSMDSKSAKSISHDTMSLPTAATLIEEADEFWIEYESKTGKDPSVLDGKSAKSKAAKDSDVMSMQGTTLSMDDTKGKEPSGHDGKSSKSKAAKEFDGISMQGSSMDHTQGKSGKVGKVSDSVDSKAFKTSIHSLSLGADAKTSKSENAGLAKSGKSLSLSLQYAESLMPSESPSLQPSAAALSRKLVRLDFYLMFYQNKRPIILLFANLSSTTEIVTARPTSGDFLFGAKTAKLFKEDGGKNATEALFEAIFGPGDKRDR